MPDYKESKYHQQHILKMGKILPPAAGCTKCLPPTSAIKTIQSAIPVNGIITGNKIAKITNRTLA